jgi:hypothetical protein
MFRRQCFVTIAVLPLLSMTDDGKSKGPIDLFIVSPIYHLSSQQTWAINYAKPSENGDVKSRHNMIIYWSFEVGNFKAAFGRTWPLVRDSR